MRLCITGGGTGGHLMIAEALAEAALKEGHELIFIGSTHGQDRRYFGERSSFSHVYFLETTGVVNQKGLAKIRALWRIFLAFLQSRKLLKKHKIEATYSVREELFYQGLPCKRDLFYKCESQREA